MAAALAALALAALFLGASAQIRPGPGKDLYSVSKAKAVVRQEPEPKAKVLWTLWRYAPVEAMSYRGDWIRIRDFEGDSGWVKRAELTHEVATVAVTSKEGKLRKNPGAGQKILWLLDKGYSLRVFALKGDWVEVSDLDEVNGWLHRDEVWGFPPPAPVPE
jgi:SH3-like domain-containing protein